MDLRSGGRQSSVTLAACNLDCSLQALAGALVSCRQYLLLILMARLSFVSVHTLALIQHAYPDGKAAGLEEVTRSIITHAHAWLGTVNRHIRSNQRCSLSLVNHTAGRN